MIQPLERRLLLANVYISGVKLRIEGTDAVESVELAMGVRNEGIVFVNGTDTLHFQLSAVHAVSFDGQGGNDSLIVGRVPVAVYANTGTGADTVSASVAGHYNDTINAGDGADYIFGGPGNDTLVGGAGGDTLMGGDDDDRLHIFSDASADDVISGGNGIDTADATHYNQGATLVVGDGDAHENTVHDALFGDIERVLGTAYDDNISVISGKAVEVQLGKGRDSFTGGSGDDTVYGQAGNDEISGAGGNDIFYMQDGTTDGVFGASGQDTIYADSFDVTDSTMEVINLA